MTIPAVIIKKLEKEVTGLEYGEVALCVIKKLGKCRYVLKKEESFLESDTAKDRKAEI